LVVPHNIPTPQELIEQHRADLTPRVGAAVQRIVAELRSKRYAGGSVSIDLQKGEYELAEHLKQAFGARGWQAEIHDDQREGSFIQLRPLAHREP
jgi:hypothetical protein